jgi:hypothetical protein
MNDVVKQTYLLLAKNNFKLSGKKLWVHEGGYYTVGNFKSIDNKLYYLCISSKRPNYPYSVIPYELFIEDEHV